MIREFSFKVEDRPGQALGLVCDNLPALADYVSRSRYYQREVAKALPFMRRGDDSLVPRAQALLDMISLETPMVDAAPTTERSVTGALADVPAFLAGSPMNMRRRVRRETLAPITIVFDASVSGALPATVIERRGVAALALLLKLEQAGHPVTLWAGGGLGPYVKGVKTCLVAARMDTQPLDLARACWTLSNEAFLRSVLFSASCQMAGGGADSIKWPWDNKNWTGNRANQVATWSALLGLEPSNIFLIPPSFVSEGGDFASDKLAAAWVEKSFAQAIAALQDSL